MAEGGYDPDDTDTFDPNEGDDESTPLFPHRDEGGIEMKHVHIRRYPPPPWAPWTNSSARRSHETSFMGDKPSGKIYVDRKEQDKEEIERRIKENLPDAKTTEFFTRTKDGQVEARLKKINSVWYPILDEDDDLIIDKNKKFPPKLRKFLGSTVEEIATEKIAEKRMANERAEERIKELHEQRENAFTEDRKRIDVEIEREQEGINERNQDIEREQEKLTLRQRIKEIFKKYGFTAFAIATAIGTVIGVIVSNLKAGLTQVAKGVGNGLKELGKKLGEILPGMIGAIASFIFRTAGEVIGFLAKNAWLLIVGLVVLAVEQFKKKNK